MYKRRVRVLFHAASPGRAVLACALARRQAPQWLECRACGVDAMALAWWRDSLVFLQRPERLGMLDEDALHWADLLVSLDEQVVPPNLPASLRHKHWPLDDASLAVQLERRIRGMVGGLSMMSRQSPVTIL